MGFSSGEQGQRNDNPAMTEANRNPVVLAFDTHPIQYRAPVFRELERQLPGAVRVIYENDRSVRGYRDAGFGR